MQIYITACVRFLNFKLHASAQLRSRKTQSAGLPVQCSHLAVWQGHPVEGGLRQARRSRRLGLEYRGTPAASLHLWAQASAPAEPPPVTTHDASQSVQRLLGKAGMATSALTAVSADRQLSC